VGFTYSSFSLLSSLVTLAEAPVKPPLARQGVRFLFLRWHLSTSGQNACDGRLYNFMALYPGSTQARP